MARSITSYSVIVRKSDQSVNFGAVLVLLVGLVVLPGWWFKALNNRQVRAYEKRMARATEVYNMVHPPTAVYTPTALSWAATPTPTSAPTVTPTATPHVAMTDLPLILKVQYSYYYPALLGPNCHPANVMDGMYCKDTTASGLPWSLNLGRGVAIPIEWEENIPLGSVVRVLAPAEMVGDYLALDYCGACIKPEYPGLIWLDFLDDHQRLPWSQDMQVQIIRP